MNIAYPWAFLRQVTSFTGVTKFTGWAVDIERLYTRGGGGGGGLSTIVDAQRSLVTTDQHYYECIKILRNMR